jgi:hypothetical protein
MDRPTARIPRTHIALAGLQLALALLATALDLARSCGACSRGGGVRLSISALGAIGYGALAVFGLRNSWTPFYRGVFAAAGVHGALGLIMALEQRSCLPCLTSLAVAMILAGHAAWTACLPSVILVRTTAPATIATLALLLPGLAQPPTREEAAGQAFQIASPSKPASVRVAQLDVYEAAHCSYCTSFRSDYLPRLEADFQGRLEVRFHDTSRFAWIERTPTFILDGKPLFEGLPYRYEDLAEAIRLPLTARNP